MADELGPLPGEWSESQVSAWLKSIGVKEQYIKKLYEEEVDGRVLLELNEDYLRKETGMRSGPAHLLITKRDELISSQLKSQERQRTTSGQKSELKGKKNKQKSATLPVASECLPAQMPETEQGALEERQTQDQTLCALTLKEDCKPRPFDKEGIDFAYVKHRVLQPESGAFDLISPCHEYKSFALAATLDRTRLQAKFAKEVFKFGVGCMNIRSNGTIHFGVMDSKDDTGYTHGEIIGIPVKEKDMYTDALDHIEKSFSTSDGEHVRQCVRPPRFIEVIDRKSTEKMYVVEVDIVPSISIVKGRVYSVRLPNFKESANKVEHEKDTVYRRVGSKSEPVSDKDQNNFYLRVKERDVQREEAEKRQFLSAPDICQDLGRKLTMLMTNGKKFLEKDKWYILVTNKFKSDDLSNLDWLLNMKIFCVFDFDPDSKLSGLCSKYIQHHAANMHFMQNYRISSGMSVKDLESHLNLFDQTSWIFCNGRTDYKGNEPTFDEMEWIRTKMTLLRESVSLICKQMLPKGTFQVIFLLTSPVEKPILHTFYEFFTDMEGHEDIICISESEENFQRWQSFAESSCGTETVNHSSVVGMKMSHINATLQQIQPVNLHVTKHLPIFVKGTCFLEAHAEENMYSLEILAVDHCDETNEDYIEAEKANIERQFYHGGKVTWLNFWLAEHGYVGEVIERDAYNDVSELLKDALKQNVDQSPVNRINIYHHPGSGGSTVARQLMWKNRKNLRCAVVKPSYSAAVVAKHAAELREYEEKDPNKCLSVLLLIEDSDQDYLDDLRNELFAAIHTKQNHDKTPCFILFSCRRSNDPETRCKESPLRNVAVTHKLSDKEKRKFAGKRQTLEECYEPKFILTFVLMSEEFNPHYVEKFVQHLLQGIDHESAVTLLIKYVALLNTYVQNSFISQSHCEALLGLTIHTDRFRQHGFENSLSEQAKLVFLHLRDDKTYIQSVRIINPFVAEEILRQLLGNQNSQSNLAMNLVCNEVLFEHRFGKEDYQGCLRALFIRRSKISRGDEFDSFFSPLVEHVCNNETPEKAIELLKKAYECFHKDPFFAQQLARLHYSFEKFEEAKHWAEIAAKQMPNNSYILDTKGQVYSKWFQAKCKAIENVPKTAQNTADAVNTALTAIECFKECEKAAVAEAENNNTSGFFSEVVVGCRLLKLIFSLQVFSNKTYGHSECIKYLTTDHIPEEIKEPWEPFHSRLKNLKDTLAEALEYISVDLSYFQKEIGEETETSGSPEMNISNPLAWLVKKSTEYAKYFIEGVSITQLKQYKSNLASLSLSKKRMIIYHLGGGNITSLLYKLTDQKERGQLQIQLLEDIISLYSHDPCQAGFSQVDLANYIVTHIALNCLAPQSPKVATLKTLQDLSKQFPADKKKCSPTTLFLLTMLSWPDDGDKEKEAKYETVQLAVRHLRDHYLTKKKDIPQRKRRIYTHFFLSNASGLNKFVHKTKLQTILKVRSISEKRMKWFTGEAWKMPEIAQMLKHVSGWTEDGKVYLEGPQRNKFEIPALYTLSVPPGNENVTFYLGFTLRGPVAVNITVEK
ncbi:sterile alpha motif domain-containing protein 9-like [Myripristis murdjan]|uniref:Sterile alpha motif domain containing 9 like n=1 Tax=Myripristis murdjan TaxID=586833 RepID=A0A667Z9D1_9TELE|nr:sterile alpha motif domain-containing protein 9-like [Myripristis murdjan]